jgi:hypothetical protein
MNSPIIRRAGTVARRGLLCLLAGMALVATAAPTVELVTPAEAGLPDADEPTSRGITRGPSLVQVLPVPGATNLRSPMQLKVDFKPHGGAHIDVASVELTYLKIPAIDLSTRLGKSVTASGIQLDGLVLPPGQHRIQLRVADSEGRATEIVLQLDVAR